MLWSLPTGECFQHALEICHIYHSIVMAFLIAIKRRTAVGKSLDSQPLITPLVDVFLFHFNLLHETIRASCLVCWLQYHLFRYLLFIIRVAIESIEEN